MQEVFGYNQSDNSEWDNLNSELQTWIQTPYSWLQKTKKRGTDCTTFIFQAFLNTGYLKKLDWPAYYRPDWYTDPNDNQLYKVLNDNLRENLRSELTYRFFEFDNDWKDYVRGDVLLFKIRRNVKVFNHSTILGDNFQMYHISSVSAVQLVEFDHRWRFRCKGLFRLYWRK